ncbi:hypothetical protein NPIL_202161 [Nephila pilipes]|uniref:Uncharacterized protein n=1 Tax=Nephila pilipes TaxID=299642 RepID=A0A8X6NYS5_NEPPI|nr:hypothetical protein NPIL_202161 [Nephila pilipes]
MVLVIILGQSKSVTNDNRLRTVHGKWYAIASEKVGLLRVDPRKVFYFPSTTQRNSNGGILLSATWGCALQGLQVPSRE